jgi:hypothetical protein
MHSNNSMEDTTKKRLFLIGLGIALIVFISFVFWFGNFLNTESSECMKSPITYYEEKTGKMCFCNDGTGWNNPRDNNHLGVIP